MFGLVGYHVGCLYPRAQISFMSVQVALKDDNLSDLMGADVLELGKWSAEHRYTNISPAIHSITGESPESGFHSCLEGGKEGE